MSGERNKKASIDVSIFRAIFSILSSSLSLGEWKKKNKRYARWHCNHGTGDKMDAHNLLAKQIIHKQQYQEEKSHQLDPIAIVEGIFG